ncbi:MAG: molybdenum cofactor guanylyltransferase [Anaerolineae bacterium]|jgi:molybdopterin-guanine dinucleotide biosynthesis protein A
MIIDPTAQPPQGISSVILAGGDSRRLGVDKALLELDGQTLLSRVVQKLAPLSDDLIIVTNNPEDYEHLALGVRFVPDERPGEGALMGIYSGLKASTYPSALTVACDMPFLNMSLLRFMVDNIAGHDAVVPRLEGGLLEPLHAVYGKQCLPFMASVLAQGLRRIAVFLDQVDVFYVEQATIDRLDPLGLSFVNINTAADWQRAQQLLDRPPSK